MALFSSAESFGSSCSLQLLLERLDARLQRLEVGARHRRHLLIRDQRLQIGALLLGRAQRLDRGHDRIEGCKLLGELGVGGLVDAGIQLRLDHVPAGGELFQLLLGDGGHGFG